MESPFPRDLSLRPQTTLLPLSHLVLLPRTRRENCIQTWRPRHVGQGAGRPVPPGHHDTLDGVASPAGIRSVLTNLRIIPPFPSLGNGAHKFSFCKLRSCSFSEPHPLGQRCSLFLSFDLRRSSLPPGSLPTEQCLQTFIFTNELFLSLSQFGSCFPLSLSFVFFLTNWVVNDLGVVNCDPWDWGEVQRTEL